MKIYTVSKDCIMQIYNDLCDELADKHIDCTNTHMAVTTSGKYCGKRIGAGTQYLVFLCGTTIVTAVKNGSSGKGSSILAALQEKLNLGASVLMPAYIKLRIASYTIMDKRRNIKVVPVMQLVLQKLNVGLLLQPATLADADNYIYLRNNKAWFIVTIASVSSSSMLAWYAAQRPLPSMQVRNPMLKLPWCSAILYKGKMYYHNNGNIGANKRGTILHLPALIINLVPKGNTWCRFTDQLCGQVSYNITLTELDKALALTPLAANTLTYDIADHLNYVVERAIAHNIQQQDHENKLLPKLLQVNNQLPKLLQANNQLPKLLYANKAKIVSYMPRHIQLFLGDHTLSLSEIVSQYTLAHTKNKLTIAHAQRGVATYALYISLLPDLSIADRIYAIDTLLGMIGAYIDKDTIHKIFLAAITLLVLEHINDRKE